MALQCDIDVYKCRFTCTPNIRCARALTTRMALIRFAVRKRARIAPAARKAGLLPVPAQLCLPVFALLTHVAALATLLARWSALLMLLNAFQIIYRHCYGHVLCVRRKAVASNV